MAVYPQDFTHPSRKSRKKWRSQRVMAVNPTGFPAPHLHPRRKNKKITPAPGFYYRNAFGLLHCGDPRRTYWPKLILFFQEFWGHKGPLHEGGVKKVWGRPGPS